MDVEGEGVIPAGLAERALRRPRRGLAMLALPGLSPEGEGRVHSSAATSFANASARWLMRCFSSGSISPKVRSWPAGRNMAS